MLRSSDLKALRARLDKSPALVPDDLKDFYTSGLTALIRKLTDRAQQADDPIDFGFLHGQANIYRLRQKILGTGLGTKLATSPVLAGIAQGDTASAVRSDPRAVWSAALALALARRAVLDPARAIQAGFRGSAAWSRSIIARRPRDRMKQHDFDVVFDR